MTPDSIKRYARHLVLKEIGGPGQQALLAARVVIIGAGGLGGPVGLYLAAAGVGHITIIDDDDVEASNLQRQVQFITTDIGLPLVSGALGRFNGQVSVFNNGTSAPCYQCLVPDIPPDSETCATVGVVGALAGVVGSVMALEVIKLITGAGQSLSGRLWLYDGLAAESRTITLPKDPDCAACRP